MRPLFCLKDGCLLAVSLHGLSFVCTHGGRENSGVSPSHLEISPIGLGPHTFDLFNLNYFLKSLSPSTAILRVRTSTYEFEGEHNSVHNKYQEILVEIIFLIHI